MVEPGAPPPPIPVADGRPGFAIRVLAPTVLVGFAGAAVASTLTATRVDAAGETHELPVVDASGETVTTSLHTTTTSTGAEGGHFESGQSTIIGPEGEIHFEPIDPTGGNVLEDGQVDLDPSMLPEGSILVEMTQHVVVTDLPDGTYHVESYIEIKVHQNGEVQTFEKYSDQIVTKQDGTDLIIQQDGSVVVHLDENGNAVVDIDGGLTVTEVPGNPYDDIPDGAVVVVQEQDVTVIDEDDGFGDDTEDPDVFGDFEQDASAIDNPTDGEVDDFVIHQGQSKTTTEVDTGSGMHARPMQHQPAQQPLQTTVPQPVAVQPAPAAQVYVDAPSMAVASGATFEPETTLPKVFESAPLSTPETTASTEEPAEPRDPFTTTDEDLTETEDSGPFGGEPGEPETDPTADPFGGGDPLTTTPADLTGPEPDPLGSPPDDLGFPPQGVDTEPSTTDTSSTGADLEVGLPSDVGAPDDVGDVSDPAQV